LTPVSQVILLELTQHIYMSFKFLG
jgi:hypothetical protein